MEPPTEYKDADKSIEKYINAIDNDDIEEIKRLINLGYPIKADSYNVYLGTLLSRLEDPNKIDSIKLIYPYLNKFKSQVLNRLFANNFYGFYDLDIGKWIINENEKLPKKDKLDFNIYLEKAIESSFDEKELKYLTDLGLISGYIDKNGELNEEFQATRAYFYPDEDYPRYKRTNRPITRISYSPNTCNKGLYLPIVRYRSLYWKQEKENVICGTFYFYEPDSDNFLNLGNVLIAANKIHAIRLLEQKDKISINNSKINNVLRDISIFTEKWEDDNIDKMDIFLYLIPNEDDDMLNIDKVSPNILYENLSEYIGNKIMGNFDYLDKWICEFARSQGYDTVLLQREPGEYRAVTEIYDVRPRNESFNNICKNTLKWDIKDTKYPAIWFSDYKFVKI